MSTLALQGRARYRVRQFFAAVGAYLRPIRAEELAAARRWLPQAAWPLFDAMPRNDQRHSLAVLAVLTAQGRGEAALMQAALLHDVAKSVSGVTLFHRVAVVLLKWLWPAWLERLARQPAPARGSLRYPFWAHVNHPRLGAEMAAAAGCDPTAVALIRAHQEPPRAAWDGGGFDEMLAALQAADGDN